MKLTITVLMLLAFAASLLSGCGAFSNDTKIEIQMYGVSKAPEGATGTSDPHFQTYKVTSITLTGADSDLVLLDSESPFKIVDRPQILVSKTADSFVGKSFTGITVVFDKTVVGGDGSQSELTFDLTTTTVELLDTFTVEENKTRTYLVKAAWGNTMSDGVMTEPTLSMVKQ